MIIYYSSNRDIGILKKVSLVVLIMHPGLRTTDLT